MQQNNSNKVVVVILVLIMVLLGFSMLSNGGYSAKDLLTKINGERTIEEIVEEMDNFIQSKI